MQGTPASTRDPARFAFAHGGKDGMPFRVDRATFDRTIEIPRGATAHVFIDRSEKIEALRRLGRFAGNRARDHRMTVRRENAGPRDASNPAFVSQKSPR